MTKAQVPPVAIQQRQMSTPQGPISMTQTPIPMQQTPMSVPQTTSISDNLNALNQEPTTFEHFSHPQSLNGNYSHHESSYNPDPKILHQTANMEYNNMNQNSSSEPQPEPPKIYTNVEPKKSNRNKEITCMMKGQLWI